MPRHTKIKNMRNETLKAGCVVVNDKGEVLLVTDRRKKIWEFPKGHAEKGETARQVAIRETKEETGYEVDIIKRLPDIAYMHRQTGELIRTAMFLARPVGEKGESEKRIFSQWFPVAEAHEIIKPKLVILLKRVGKRARE